MNKKLELKTKNQIMLKVLIREREKILEELCGEEINEAIVHRKVILSIGNKGQEEFLVQVKKNIDAFKLGIEIIDAKLKELTK